MFCPSCGVQSREKVPSCKNCGFDFSFIALSGGADAQTAQVVHKGITLFHGGKLEEAKDLWKDFLKENPQSDLAFYYLGVINYNQGLLDQAIENFTKAKDINHEYPAIHYRLGLAYEKNSLFDQAIAELEEAVLHNPQFVIAQYILAHAYFQKGRLDDSIREYEKIVQHHPKYAAAYFFLGVAYYRKGKADESIANLKRALELSETHTAGHYQLGLALIQKGALEEAAQHFQRLLQLDPQYTAAYFHLGTVYNRLNRLDQATQYLEKAVGYDSSLVEAHYQLGITYYQDKGMLKEAKRAFKKVLELNPDNESAAVLLRQVLKDYRLNYLAMQSFLAEAFSPRYHKEYKEFQEEYAEGKKTMAGALAAELEVAYEDAFKNIEELEQKKLIGFFVKHKDGEESALNYLDAKIMEEGEFPYWRRFPFETYWKIGD
jgi:tetratricopeptide (TPR) repeat protein